MGKTYAIFIELYMKVDLFIRLIGKQFMLSLYNFQPSISRKIHSKPAHGEVYLIQLYVRKFVSDLRQVCGFFRIIRFPPQ